MVRHEPAVAQVDGPIGSRDDAAPLDGRAVVATDDELFARVYPELWRIAAVVASAETDPDDLVQEAVSRALKRGPLTALDNPTAYLRRAIVNVAANERRRLGRWRRAIRKQMSSAVGDRPADYPSDIADLLALPADARAVVWLVDVEGWSFEDVAELLGCSVGAARGRAFRARRQLRNAITEEGQ